MIFTFLVTLGLVVNAGLVPPPLCSGFAFNNDSEFMKGKDRWIEIIPKIEDPYIETKDAKEGQKTTWIYTKEGKFEINGFNCSSTKKENVDTLAVKYIKDSLNKFNVEEREAIEEAVRFQRPTKDIENARNFWREQRQDLVSYLKECAEGGSEEKANAAKEVLKSDEFKKSSKGLKQ
jgi:hypothetical protein